MRGAVAPVLLALCAMSAVAAYPERLLDWEELAAPPGSWPPSALASARGGLYTNGGRESRGRNPGGFRLDTATDAWIECGFAGRPVRDLGADGDALYAVVGDRKAAELYRSTQDGDWLHLVALPEYAALLGVSQAVAYVSIPGTDGGLSLLDLATGGQESMSLRVRDLDIDRVSAWASGSDSSVTLGTASGHSYIRVGGRSTWLSSRYGPPGYPILDVVGDSMGATAVTSSGVFHQEEDMSETWSAVGGVAPGTVVSAAAVTGWGQTYIATAAHGVYERARDRWEPRNEGLWSLDVRALGTSRPGRSDSSVYAATFGGGVHVLLPDSGSWLPMTRGLTNLWALSLSVVEDVVYVGTTEGRIFRWDWSDDSVEWRRLPAPAPGGDVLGVAATPEAIYAATPGGPYVSKRDGDVWEGIDVAVRADAAMTTHAGRLYVASWGGDVFSAGVGANGWTRVLPALDYGGVHAIAADGDALYVATFYGVFVLEEPGGAWMRLSPGGITNDGIIRYRGDTESDTFMPQWDFHDIAIADGAAYGATQTRLVRARLRRNGSRHRH